MTNHDRVSVNPNGDSVQVYFKKEFARDTTFPLKAGEDVVAYVTDAGGVHLLPLSAVDGDWPAELDGPPDDALPPEHRPRTP